MGEGEQGLDPLHQHSNKSGCVCVVMMMLNEQEKDNISLNCASELNIGPLLWQIPDLLSSSSTPRWPLSLAQGPLSCLL